LSEHDHVSDQPFIDRLEPGLAGELRRLGRWRPFSIGETLTKEGESGHTALIIDSGLVKVTTRSAPGDEVLLAFRGRGELLGEMSALRGTARSATATGHQRGGVIELAADTFQRFVWARPQLFAALLDGTSQRLRRSDLQRLSYATNDVGTRVGLALLDWAQDHGKLTEAGTEITLRASRRELAQWVVASEKTVDHVLTQLTRAGLVSTGRRRFVVLDPLGLHEWTRGRGRCRDLPVVPQIRETHSE
jgi:CRP/FNR family transcriptional regulator, cyclic AMP receptor protein